MSQDHQHQPVDMNQMFRGVAQEVVDHNVGLVMANTLITAGNALRAQGYGMIANIDAKQLLQVPALLSNGSSLCLLPFFRPVQGFFRLLISHTADGARTVVAFLENEANTLQTGFLDMTEEQAAELNRQLDLLIKEPKGSIELGLMLVEKPVEGFEYFTAPPKAEEAASTDAPAAAPAPVALSTVIGDVAPGDAAPAAGQAPAA